MIMKTIIVNFEKTRGLLQLWLVALRSLRVVV